jgi:hypothetical protein
MRGCHAVGVRQETIESFPILAGLDPANPDVVAAWITRTNVGLLHGTGDGHMRQVVSYIRVSAAQQGRSGLGMDARRAAIARFAEAEGCTVLGEFVKVERGNLRRRQLRAQTLRDDLALLLPRP